MDARASTPPLSPRGRWIAAALLAVYLGLALWGARTKSETYDEPMYILSAYSYVVTGDLSFNREHPPLAKYLMGLPLLALDLELPAGYHSQPGTAYNFLTQQPRAAAPTILFLSRLGGIVLGLVLGLYLLRWGRLAFGETAGLAALALGLLNPNVLAHCRVAANDFAATVFILAACYHVWRWLETDRRGSLCLGALTLGLALGSKLTALMLLPVVGLILLAVAVTRRRPAVLGWATLALLGAGGVLWLLYLGEARSLEHARLHARFIPRGEQDMVFVLRPLEQALEAVFGATTPIPLLSFLKGIDHQFAHADHGHLTYFWGTVNLTGHWAFYLVTTLLKNPEGFLALVLLAFVVWRRSGRGWVHEALLLAFVASQYLLFSRASVQLGFKYILPVVPFLAIHASRVLADGLAVPRRLARGAAVGLVVVTVALHLVFDEPGEHTALHWAPLAGALAVAALLWRAPLVAAGDEAAAGDGASLVSPRTAGLVLVLLATAGALLHQPHNLMYFNELAGGPDLGSHYAVVGDDWGQDTALLGRWMAQHDVEHLYYDYYGTAEPETWGVHYTPTFASQGFSPITGLVAVHAVLLKRMPVVYAWLAEEQPVAVLGGTIHVFDIDEQDAARIEQLAREARQAAAARAAQEAAAEAGAGDPPAGG